MVYLPCDTLVEVNRQGQCLSENTGPHETSLAQPDEQDFFGLPKKDRKLNPEEEQMLMTRKEARKDQNYEEADDLRTKLAEKGIEIRDTKEGEQIWHFK